LKNRTWPTPRDEQILLAIATHTYLTANHIRSLFFRHGRVFTARQTVGVRLRRLRETGYLTAVLVDGGRGAGPYAYGLTPQGEAMIGIKPKDRRGRQSAPRHALEVADLRVALELALDGTPGGLVSWTGERELRALTKPGDPVPDGLIHWQLRGREGLVAVELDRGTESFSTLVRKLDVYDSWWRKRRYRTLVAGLGLKPRLAVVAGETRARQLAGYIARSRPFGGTIAVAPAHVVLAQPLGRSWWRSDVNALERLFG